MDTAAFTEEEIAFDSEGLQLEGIFAYPDAGQPRAAVLLLAPHPHMGGNMDNNVVRHLARRCAACGAASLRFNYRGVGRSEMRLEPGESRFDHFAAMEAAQRYEELLPDARAAYETLVATIPDAPRRVILGYSLGAVLAGMLARVVPATHLIGVSPPVRRAALFPHGDSAARKFFVAGDDDFAFEWEMFEEQYGAAPPPKAYSRLAGCDHFFRRDEERVFQTVAPYVFGGEKENYES